MREELLSGARQAVQIATEAGAQGVFATTRRSRDVEFSMRDGELETVKDATSRGLSLRLYVDGRYSASSTNDLRPESIRSFVTEAVALTRALAEDPHRSLPDPALYEGRAELDLQLHDPAVAELDRDDRLALCEAAQQAISGADGLISATSGTSDGHVVEAMVSSNGFEGVQENTYLWTGSEVTLRDAGDKKPANWYWGGACRRSDVPDAATTAKEALERTARMLGAEKGPTKKTVMVVDARSAGSLLRRLLSGASGRAVQQDQSFWAGQLGQQLFSERLTLIDDPLLVRGLGSRLFDGEGIAAKPLPLVEKGVLRNYYLDTYYAKKLGVAPTTGGNSNIVVELGDRGLDELLADADGGIYVDAWLGGNADTTTGDFSMGCRGRLIEGGTLGAPVTEMNITGNLADLFARLEAVGNDPYPYSSLRAPTLVFGDVQFAGV